MIFSITKFPVKVPSSARKNAAPAVIPTCADFCGRKERGFHNRRSIRLRGYDYTSAGAYFATICLNERIAHGSLPQYGRISPQTGEILPDFDFPTLGTVENNVMVLNDFGKIVEKYILEIINNTDKFSNIRIGEYVIMPDHVHAIIEIGHIPGNNNTSVDNTRNRTRSGRPTCLPILRNDNLPNSQQCSPNSQRCSQFRNDNPQTGQILSANRGRHTGLPLRSASGNCPPAVELGTVIQWLKTMTTNEYIKNVKTRGWMPFEKRLWQRNYYERIIHDDIGYAKIERYIRKNPVSWKYSKRRILQQKSAFTLLEVLVVVIIIGILAALAYSSFMDLIFTSRAKEAAQTMRTFAERALAEGKRQNKKVELGLNGSNIRYNTVIVSGTAEILETPAVTAALGNNFSKNYSTALSCGDASNIPQFAGNKVKSKLTIGISSLEQEDGYFAACDGRDYCAAAVKVKNKNSFVACIKKGNSAWEAL